ncbi:MAG TPA: HD domain-containing protein [Clostridia bacterium]|nr:HD domain-containing protein [Clostridia bacterium]
MITTHRVRDPIHGMIYYSDLEEAVINTPVVQRLRGIKQLALTEYAYPGAKHSRFEHSLGTMHIAGRLAKKVGLSEEECNDVRLAALLHDLGHGPFSHVPEPCLREFSPGTHGVTEEIHEQVTVTLISSDGYL